MTFVRPLCVATMIVMCIAHPSRAQEPQRAPQVITGRDQAILAAGTLGAAAVSMFDVKIARFFAESSLHRHRLDVASHRTSAVTETLLMITGSSVWAIGRLSRGNGTAEVALHTTEAVASGAAFIQIIRGIGGRARPFVVEDSTDVRDSNQYDFEWFHGFRSYNYRSFPSMHAMASFAAATALSKEMQVHRTRYRQFLSPMLFIAASASPAARMYLDEHWASDITLGALIGIFAGQKTVSYSHSHSQTPIDRFLLKRQTNLGVSFSAGRITPVLW
jgi:membrane-associated phospholipid phosphatase